MTVENTRIIVTFRILKDFVLDSASLQKDLLNCAKSLRERTIELRVNQYEPSGVTPAKRAPVEVAGVLTVGSDQSLLENFVAPTFDDTFQSVKEVRVHQLNMFTFSTNLILRTTSVRSLPLQRKAESPRARSNRTKKSQKLATLKIPSPINREHPSRSPFSR